MSLYVQPVHPSACIHVSRVHVIIRMMSSEMTSQVFKHSVRKLSRQCQHSNRRKY